MPPSVPRSLAGVAAGLAAAAAIAAAADRQPAAPPVSVGPPPRVVAPAESDDPRTEPGLVRWHPSFAAAQAAAQKSGRPVLLFHQMGRLDHRFC